ncbi:hypothetical protein ACLI09_15190 [Flavobacterium sp. RHBU_24]|uniref:hypothetical protein n=1 Tax=Flavobacterium sp. RHBU_24 TaxID=3391185 RepID=UPI003984E947
MSETTPIPEDYFEPIKLQSPQNQLAWLITKTEEICNNNELLKSLVKNHMITKAEYNNALSSYWGTNVPKSTTFPLSTFLGENCTFAKYYVFSVNGSTHAITNTLAPFNFNGHNYSICFFKGLPLKFAGVSVNSSLKFTEGRINGKNVIVFCIEGITDAYFDFTNNPPGKP